MERVIILANGKVQRVGYRDLVFDIAIDLGVVGFVENQKDGTVKIIGEAGREILREFVDKIQPNDDPLIKVNQTNVEYEKATKEFDHFEIRRGSSYEETGERLDTVGKALKELIKTTAKMNVNLGGKIDNVADKQDQTIESINKGFTETKQEFTTLRDDYGKISQTMEKILESMDNTSKKTEQVLERLTQQQESFTQAINGLTGAILKLAEKSS